MNGKERGSAPGYQQIRSSSPLHALQLQLKLKVLACEHSVIVLLHIRPSAFSFGVFDC